MLNTKFQKDLRRFRKQQRKLLSNGYRMHETDWEILRGGRRDDIIVDVQISTCGKYVYTKLGKHPTKGEVNG